MPCWPLAPCDTGAGRGWWRLMLWPRPRHYWGHTEPGQPASVPAAWCPLGLRLSRRLSLSLSLSRPGLGSIRGVGTGHTGHQSSVSQSLESDSWPTSVTIIILSSPHATITSIWCSQSESRVCSYKVSSLTSNCWWHNWHISGNGLFLFFLVMGLLSSPSLDAPWPWTHTMTVLTPHDSIITYLASNWGLYLISRDKWVDGCFLSLAPSSPENNLTLSSEPLSSGNVVGPKQFIRNIKTRILFQEGKLQTIRVCKTLNCRSSWWSQRCHILISQEFADH